MATTAPLPTVTEPEPLETDTHPAVTDEAPFLSTSHAVSPTLAAGEALEARLRRGERVLPMAFGEAGVPAAHILRYALAAASSHNGYGPVAGAEALREAAAGYWARRALPTSPDDVVCGPGSKALLYGLLLSLGGSGSGSGICDVAVPRPSWVSYAAQASLTGVRPVYVPVPCGPGGVPAAGGVPDPGRLADAASAARSEGRRIGAVIVTLPDNPTGTLAGAGVVRELCQVARRHDMLIISDEIYRDLAFDGPGAVTSPASLAPERTVITSGLSKNLALGGWRLGVARLPSGLSGLRSALLANGSEIWSAPAAPVQQAATLAFEELPDIRQRVEVSRRLHGRITREVASRFAAAGALVAPPAGAFYLYPDFGPHRELLAGRYGVKTSADLADLLLERYGIGVLPGSAFGDPDTALRIRVATSRLYGDTASRQEAALAASNPAALPWIASSLDWIAESLTDLVS
ncbi:MAG: pyridoxal phosphate-dependent aminotransferase [Nocardiopsaceae bacterium]|nr:pyridoxal phosphate-dependent aminotransferase [Nocardiopsaceae bacterium]